MPAPTNPISPVDIDRAIRKQEPNTNRATPKAGIPTANFAFSLMNKLGRIVLNAWTGGLTFPSQTSGFMTSLSFTTPTANRTVTFPDGSGTVGLQAMATLAASATPSFAPASSISTYGHVPASAETINAVTTGAITARPYFLIITTSGTSSYVVTFGTNFKTTGTLTTGTVSAKVFVIQFIFNGTSFIEVSRTTAI